LTVAETRGSDIADVAQAMRDARRITAICHENPDADTIGAAIAVCLVGERLGAETEIVSADGFPPAFSFLPRADQVHRKPGLEPDLAVICDAATLERVGRILTEQADWFAGARILNVDHHISSSYYGDLNLVDPAAAATCQVLAGLVDALGVELDADLASALLTGIVRDSQGFSDGATSGETLRVAARLVDAGAPIALIQRRVLSELPFPTIALWGKMLDGVGQDGGGRIVHAALTLAMLEETGTEQHDADGLAEFLAKAKGADVTLLLRELGPDETRVSVRCSDAVDATTITAPFGGGGHVRRAGCTVRRHLDEAIPLVLEASRAALGDDAGVAAD
jgi:phosphoesterase RecJ-like protein